ncbi:MAG TPA: hypothetical protein H9742_06685 [Candidatus Acetatifactor stercoripullorum]|uniref:Uncharacterized protein n=1 Tax=Candidatus Acetatifactor stercoripullorum TaxID=2838414 RepID=A0A9D1R5C9_9FIRM|nr:hypothetical protein [Candidatus Acetatifactor stercoripullorum]
MISINGLNKFREFFAEYDSNYVLIGGTACAIIFNEIGESFRATKDLDIVLVVENINDEFGRKLWDFIKNAEYDVEFGREKKSFYRFKNPKNNDFPKMIELFSRNQKVSLPEGIHLIPIHVSDEISSLSAILLNDDYYQLMIRGKRVIDGISVLDEKYLIPFKAKAWCELVERRKKGEEGQSRNIKKHCKDIADLVGLLRPDERIEVSGIVKIDMQTFVDDILTSEFVPGNVDGTKWSILVYTLFSRIFDLMQPPVVKHSIVVA